MRQSQLLLPILDALQEGAGRLTTAQIYDAVAERTGISGDKRDARITLPSGQTINSFERSVRWAQQRARLMNLAEPIGETRWRLTGKGKRALTESLPGKVVTVFVTDKGAALWCKAEDGIGLLEDGSVNLIFTSPPYPLLREKQYGNVSAKDYVDWFLRLAEQWPRKLAHDGSVVINLGDVWEPGRPTVSTYQERLLVKLEDQLGLKLCQRYAWASPSRLPAHAEWCTVRRIRVKNSLEQIYWLSPSGEPYADNRAVLTGYSESMKDRLAAGGERGAQRPSGHTLAAGAFGRDNGGAIPGNLITAANSESNSRYIKSCKSRGLPVHPARFPGALPEFFVRLTTQPGQLVLDPCAGSIKTGEVCERLGRHWVAFDTVREYIEGAKARFGLDQPSLFNVAACSP